MALGTHLRRIREERGISVEEISQKTKISTRLLEAIENEQFDRVPGGLIGRSFVRQYARELGIDEDMTEKEYLQASAERVEGSSVLQGNTPNQSISAAADYARIILAILGIGILLAGLAYGGYRLSDFMTADQIFAEARTGEPSAAVPAEMAENDEPIAVAAEDSETTPVAAFLPSEELDLQIASHGTAWLSITTDGVREWQGIMQANQTRDVQAAESISLTVGDAGAVSLTLNGNAMPELGLPGQVRNLTITARDVAESSP